MPDKKPQAWTILERTQDGLFVNIGVKGYSPIVEDVSKEEGERMVVDHNALAGVPDPAEFMEAHRELVEAIETVASVKYIEDIHPEPRGILLKALARVRKARGG